MPTSVRTATKKPKAAGGRAGPAGRTQKATKTRRQKPASRAAAGELPKVRVRMYRQGLGDCFLLTFYPDGEERHVLIDCGTLGSKYTQVKLPDVIDEIADTTKGHLHLVVGTHEHQDHLSGFPRLSDRFRADNNNRIDNVWLAWTENPKDQVALKLAKTRDSMRVALKSAVEAMRMSGGKAEDADAINSLLEFSDAQPDPSHLAAAVSADGHPLAAARNSMEVARGLVKEPEYLSPGTPAIEPDWLPDFRFYVLGPPTNKDLFSDTGEKGGSDLYSLTAFAGAAQQLAARARKKKGDDEEYLDSPFDDRFRFKRSDPDILKALKDSYFNESQDWRTIESDWLNGANDLAIKLDKLTNNTSLVLAIERIADGKILLFPGDAQEGNWLSWHDKANTWDVKRSDGKTVSVAAGDLLARTVFYKVGHHSSHNATMKTNGLELMTNQSELTAFIPVDRSIALSRSPKNTWKMPARQLYRRLLEQCDGRVVRSDLGWAGGKQGDRLTESELVGLGTDAEWAAWTKSQGAASHVQITPTYIEFTLV